MWAKPAPSNDGSQKAARRAARLKPDAAAHPAVAMPRIGVISDTHGLLRPEAVAFLRGSDLIIHGGDIGHAGVLEDLASLAPVIAVRGNNDTGPWAEKVAETEVLQIGEVFIFVVHNITELDLDPMASG
jgi:uncharacterized protein